MTAMTATAPGKIILFGEHAVVYGRPAIAVPVNKVRARAIVMAEPRGQVGEIRIEAPDVGLETSLEGLPKDHPIRAAVEGVISELGITRAPACTLRITSTIPISAGMGSGAAVSVALIRALSSFLGHPLSNALVSELAFEVEKIHHGIPSGIDNTVITNAMPVYYVRGQPVETLNLPESFKIVIGDTGLPSSTALAVGELRHAWQLDQNKYNAIFDSVAGIVREARAAIENGNTSALGPLMYHNHEYLRQLGVSSPELDRLVEAVRNVGAAGAKLSGGGKGGNMIVLSSDDGTEGIESALRAAGAVRTIVTTIEELKSIQTDV
ncbi:mevalonate kinase [Chloroflexota bacterium]